MYRYLSYSPIDTAIFPDSYTHARYHLLKLAEWAIGNTGEHMAFQCAGVAPDNQELFSDTLWLGAADASKVLVLLSGTHGIEGFAGSAIQFDLLRLLAAGELKPPSDTALLLVHALTPWGYAWLRRCDEDGVDLNRNAVDFSKPTPENPGYKAIRSALFSPDFELRKQLFSAYAQEHGRTALEIAVSGGQYQDSAGPFYGGTKKAHGRQVTETLIQHYRLQEKNLAVIDLHTGLGPYGYGEIICDHPADSTGTHIAQAWYGDSVTLPALGTSSSVPKTGLVDYLWHDAMNSWSCHVTLEFGSYPTDQLFEVLLKDHQLWANENTIVERQEHSRRMLSHFCPEDDAWKAMVLFRGRQVIAQALQGLAAG